MCVLLKINKIINTIRVKNYIVGLEIIFLMHKILFFCRLVFVLSYIVDVLIVVIGTTIYKVSIFRFVDCDDH